MSYRERVQKIWGSQGSDRMPNEDAGDTTLVDIFPIPEHEVVLPDDRYLIMLTCTFVFFF